MDWDLAIKRNSEALMGIVETLFAMLGLAGTDTVARFPRSVHSAVLRLLQPAESALRRLIVIAARGLELIPSPSRAFPVKPIGKGLHARPCFKLFDPRKNFAELRGDTAPRILPRIHVFGSDPRVAALWSAAQRMAGPAPLPPDGLVNGAHLSRRLQALKAALHDLPRQARRLARWRVRRGRVPGLKFRSPLRPGCPPGHRKRPVHEIDEVLVECHGLACYAMKPDTS